MNEKVKEFLNNDSIIAFDSSIYLNIYEYSPEFADFFVEITKKIIDRMILPNTVKREFDKNHRKCHGRQKHKFNHIPKNFKKNTTIMKDKIINQFNILKKYQFPDIEPVQNAFEEKLNEIDEMFDNYVEQHNIYEQINSDFLDQDSVYELIQDLIMKEKLLNGFVSDELYNICDEGEKRYKNDIPPGFEDKKDKTGIEMYNDLIIWKEVLKYCKENKKDLIFVTDDLKKDWWEINNNNHTFHPALTKEFESFTSQKIIGLTFNELFSSLIEIFEFEKPNTVEIVLGYDIENYIEGLIDNGINADVIGELSYTGDNYVDTDTLSNYDGTSFEISDEEEEIDFLSYEFEGFNNGEATYILTFDVKIKAYSHEYWGRDDETKDIILSDRRTHLLNGEIKVEITREVDTFIDDLMNDYSYSTIRIISGNLYEEYSYTNDDLCVECGNNIGMYPHSNGGLVCEGCAVVNHEGDICPRCGRKVPHDLMAGNGYCMECTQEDYDL